MYDADVEFVDMAFVDEGEFVDVDAFVSDATVVIWPDV